MLSTLISVTVFRSVQFICVIELQKDEKVPEATPVVSLVSGVPIVSVQPVQQPQPLPLVNPLVQQPSIPVISHLHQQPPVPVLTYQYLPVSAIDSDSNSNYIAMLFLFRVV